MQRMGNRIRNRARKTVAGLYRSPATALFFFFHFVRGYPLKGAQHGVLRARSDFSGLEQLPQRIGVSGYMHCLWIGGKPRIFFAPYACPVCITIQQLISFFRDGEKRTFVVFGSLGKFIQRNMIDQRKAFFLKNIRQCFIQLPLGNGLAARARRFCDDLLRKTVFSLHDIDFFQDA